MKNLSKFTSKFKTSQMRNNTQKVLLRLLRAEGEWVSRAALALVSPSASARVRDLRKSEYGRIEVECRSAKELKRTAPRGTFFYRINPRRITKTQLDQVLRLDRQDHSR